jgi:hypothetical protein
VLDDPIFRADLFDHEHAPPGNLRAAHFHDHFEGVEPCDRIWPPQLKQDPIAWLRAELSDLPHILSRANVDVDDEAAVERDTDALHGSLDVISSAVESTWACVRAQPVAAETASTAWQ